MKVIHLNYSSGTGGAAKAAYRIHQGLIKSNINSEMWVNKLDCNDTKIRGPSNFYRELSARLRTETSRLLCRRQIQRSGVYHSLALFPSHWPKLINTSNADVVHLHWINGEMLSIKDITKIKKPIVWTLHDMWAFSGAEHISYTEKWKLGYTEKRPNSMTIDWNRFTWKRKMKHWKKPLHLVTPSKWLHDCVRESPLMEKWPVSVIPNCLDTAFWQPICKTSARNLLGVSSDTTLIGFGSFGGNSAFHKGADLLNGALKSINTKIPNLELVIFGRPQKLLYDNFGWELPTHYVGHLYDEISMRAMYSACDVIVVPSRNEAFGQVACEAIACGTPVVCFNTAGLKDIVVHKKSGYLAKCFQTEDLQEGILWVVEHISSTLDSSLDRNKLLKKVSVSNVIGQYLKVYERAIENEFRR